MFFEVPSWFFDRLAEFDPVKYPQDSAGGEVPTPSIAAILVPCCVQEEGPRRAGDSQGRRGSESDVHVFFSPSDPPGRRVMQALKANDRVQVLERPRAIILDGPPFDASGRGVVFEAWGRDVR